LKFNRSDKGSIMRRLNLQALSSVSIATLAAVAFPAAAQAQTEQQQVDAQRINNANAQDAERCRRLESDEARAACLRTASTDEQQLPQSGAPSGEEVVVTGSRIARPNFDSATPSVVIDAAQIENRGFETLGQAINEQPAFGVPGASPVGAAQGGSFGSGQSFVNFLGLGSQRTLTLVNGRRFVTSNTASIFGPSAAGSQVDLSAINTRLVERVETIAIGGAPIYGSDAIAGTVNVILRRDFEGIEIDGQYGIGEPGDAANYRVRAIAGFNFAGDRGNVVLSGEYNRGEGLVYNDRPATRANRFYGPCNPGSQFSLCLFNDRRIPAISESGIPSVGGELFGLNFPLSPGQQELIFGAAGFNFGVGDQAGNQLQFDT
jgi:outer membrane receptor protein involved in Fe transport